MTESHRLYSGVFGYSESDIAAAYSCGVFPKIRPPFIHEDRQYTVGGSASGAQNYAFSYELVPAAQYGGRDKQPYSCEGSGSCRGKQYRIGPKTKLIQRLFTVEELVMVMRKMFAHSGMFGSGKTHHQLLRRMARDQHGRSWADSHSSRIGWTGFDEPNCRD